MAKLAAFVLTIGIYIRNSSERWVFQVYSAINILKRNAVSVLRSVYAQFGYTRALCVAVYHCIEYFNSLVRCGIVTISNSYLFMCNVF